MSTPKHIKLKREALQRKAAEDRKYEKLMREVTTRKQEFKPLKQSTAYRRDVDHVPSSSMRASADSCALKPKKEYTGDLIKGIATMHKSNLVPVSNQQDAIDIANMRRS